MNITLERVVVDVGNGFLVFDGSGRSIGFTYEPNSVDDILFTRSRDSMSPNVKAEYFLDQLKGNSNR